MDTPVQLWIREGSALEDKPVSRVARHFHNPLRPWNQAGLLGANESSVLWQQNPAQDTDFLTGRDGSWSWSNARDEYLKALTGARKPARDEAFARVFRAIGQVMHLVQDASLPAHTRNDPHLQVNIRDVKVGDSDGYEDWVDAKVGQAVFLDLLATPLRPIAGIFTRTEHPSARAPVARLIDSDRYVGSNPEVLGQSAALGLAEYSNGNLLSDDTNSLAQPTEDYPYPVWESVALGPPEEVTIGQVRRLRRYFHKVRHGELIPRLAVASALHDFLPEFLQRRRVGLDERVLEGYAVRLLPRAVGYTAALVDHFFRGEVETLREGGGFRFANRVADEAMTGTFSLYYERQDGERALLRSWALSLPADGKSEQLPLPSPPGDMVPGSRYLLVFKGSLGDEPGAVFGHLVTLEPAYLLVLRSSGACDRLPLASRPDCPTHGKVGPLPVALGDAPVDLAPDAFARTYDSVTVGPALYPHDNPSGLYLNHAEHDYRLLYLYWNGIREGSASLELTIGTAGAAPVGIFCSIGWSVPTQSALAFGSASWADSPDFDSRLLGSAAVREDGTYRLSVGQGPIVLFVVAVQGVGVLPPVPGVYESETRCHVRSMRLTTP